jgi:hypothetical protein
VKRLAEYARRKGFSFDASSDVGMQEHYPFFQFFRQGDSRRGCNFLRGRLNGARIVLFDFVFETGCGESHTVRTASAVIVEARVDLTLFICPKGFHDESEGLYGDGVVDAPTKEFKRRYRVRTRDRVMAKAFLHPKMVEYLLRAPVFAVEIHGGSVLVYQEKVFDEADFETAVAHVRKLISLIPEALRGEDGEAQS